MKMRTYAALACCLLAGPVGCAQLSSMDLAFKKSIKSITPKANDDVLDSENSWVDQAGIEARGDRAIEVDRDPLRKYLNSSTALSIERNLGIQ